MKVVGNRTRESGPVTAKLCVLAIWVGGRLGGVTGVLSAFAPSFILGTHLMYLLGTNCAGQLHYDSPLHPVSPVFLIRQVVPRSERDPHFSDGLMLQKSTVRSLEPTMIPAKPPSTAPPEPQSYIVM